MSTHGTVACEKRVNDTHGTVPCEKRVNNYAALATNAMRGLKQYLIFHQRNLMQTI